MQVSIIGGGGVIGHKLARALAARGELRGTEITRLILADVVPPAEIGTAPCPVDYLTVDMRSADALSKAIPDGTDVVFLLAAIVSGHAEAEFDEGYAVNLTGTLNVLERVRALGTNPVLVFTSSIAVFGGDVPDPITDISHLNPQTSYGTQKAIAELLVTDYSRKGFFDGRGVRLPTISVRPGKANKAASSFMSSIIREPLNGVEAICPVDDSFPHYYLSPRTCVQNLIRIAEVEAADLGQNRCMTMPGRTWTIRQLIDAMTAVAGPEPARLIRWEPQPDVQRIVTGWRYDIHADKALSLGLTADDSFEDNVRYYLEDDRP